MKALLAVRDPRSSSSRIRSHQYIPAFESMGVEVRSIPFSVKSRSDVARYGVRLLAMARWADVVVLYKPSQPVSMLRALAKINPHLVVDVDDAVWVSGTDPSITSGNYARRFAEAVGLAREVVAGSEHLAATITAQFNPTRPPWVIRPSVVGSDWGLPIVRPARSTSRGGAPETIAGDERRQSVSPARAEDDVPVAGWIGSPGNYRDFGPEVLTALRDVVGAGTARLRLVSEGSPDWPGIRPEVLPWSRDSEVSMVRDLDMGLMPLNDDARSRGRCGYKAIQYLAAGIPVVASPMGAAAEIVGRQEVGSLAMSRDDWRVALEGLASDPIKRSQLGHKGKLWVASEATVEATAPRWLDVLRCATE